MIEVRNVTKKYGDFVAVDNISFSINTGEIIGFLGPNGAGKTTTMNMITGFISQTEGQIIINGYDTLKKPKLAKKAIGYMPENIPLYQELTVKEFIGYMAELKEVNKKEKKQKVDELIEKIGLQKVRNKLIRNISRGYKQRVELAGALIGNPKVLILDEPTVGLDPKQIVQIRELIKSLAKEHTVILSSHILSEVSQICDKVIIINNGKIIAEDTPKNLEDKLKGENKILITIEDKENKIEKIINTIKEITKYRLVKDNEDGTKEIEITTNEDVDIRKELFEKLSKEEMTIYEMKKKEITLEDAFMRLIDLGEMEEKLNDSNT